VNTDIKYEIFKVLLIIFRFNQYYILAFLIKNPFPRVYYILNETYTTQVLVINELSSEDVLFLRCLSPKSSPILINKLTEDFELNKNNKLYVDYMNQFFNSHKKGDELNGM